jgi:hypothetical protein
MCHRIRCSPDVHQGLRRLIAPPPQACAHPPAQDHDLGCQRSHGSCLRSVRPPLGRFRRGRIVSGQRVGRHLENRTPGGGFGTVQREERCRRVGTGRGVPGSSTDRERGHPTYDRAEYLRPAWRARSARRTPTSSWSFTTTACRLIRPRDGVLYGDRRVRYGTTRGQHRRSGQRVAGRTFRSTRGQYQSRGAAQQRRRRLGTDVPRALVRRCSRTPRPVHGLLSDTPHGSGRVVSTLPPPTAHPAHADTELGHPQTRPVHVRLALVDRAVPVAMASVFRRAAAVELGRRAHRGRRGLRPVARVLAAATRRPVLRAGALTRLPHPASAHSATHRVDTAFLWCYEHSSAPRLQHLPARAAARAVVARFRTGPGSACCGEVARGRRALLARALRELRSRGPRVRCSCPCSRPAGSER